MNNKNKIIILSLFILICLSISIIIFISKSNKNITGKSLSGLAVYVSNGTDYEADDEIPTGSSYSLNTDLSYCKGNGEIGEYDSTNGTISFEFTSGDSCYLYFDYVSISYANDYFIELAQTDTTNMATDTHGTNNEYTNYRYIGANPNNFACFDNGSNGCLNYNKSTGKETVESAGLFRIIGVFNEDTHGISGNQLVKIVSAESYYNTMWDNDYGVNNWVTSSTKSKINSLSDDGYYSSIPSIQIASITWKLGGYSTNAATSKIFYNNERIPTFYKDNDSTWVGKIGLIYPSDYGYATSGGTTTRDTCLGYNLSTWSLYEQCYQNDWLLYLGARTGAQGTASGQWTISHVSSEDYRVFYVKNLGTINYAGIDDEDFNIVITFYLESNVYISGGTGISSDPYRLAM